MTVDVEEIFHTEAAREVITRADWSEMPRRVEAGMDTLLSLFDDFAIRATLFVLGDIADHHPGLIRRWSSAGHEIACHGQYHDRLHTLDAASFRRDLAHAKHTLEDLTGQAVTGYRAPTWSVTHRTDWAVDVLRETGFVYDASIFPVRHPQYGEPDMPTEPYWLSSPAGPLLEIPPLVAQWFGRNIPAAGGGYFRQMPLSIMQRALSQARRQHRPAVLYFHPWEFDPQSLILPLGPIARWRTYRGLSASRRRLETLLLRESGADVPWCTIQDALPALRRIANNRPIQRLGDVPPLGKIEPQPKSAPAPIPSRRAA